MKRFLKDVWIDMLIGVPLLWTTFWACAVDTPGKRGEIAILMVFIGLATMGFIVFGIPFVIGILDKKRPRKGGQTNNITNK